MRKTEDKLGEEADNENPWSDFETPAVDYYGVVTS